MLTENSAIIKEEFDNYLVGELRQDEFEETDYKNSWEAKHDGFYIKVDNKKLKIF